jgi:hypothetical protein
MMVNNQQHGQINSKVQVSTGQAKALPGGVQQQQSS